MRSTIVSALVFVFAIIAVAVTQQSPKFDIPVLPTQKNEFGGRPGTFHFVTNEQTMADAAQLQQTFAALDRLETNISALDASTRARLQPELKTLRAFATSAYDRRASSAGPVASEVEQRLNDSKGRFMCGACHGHGMMHGGSMHMRGPGPGRKP